MLQGFEEFELHSFLSPKKMNAEVVELAKELAKGCVDFHLLPLPASLRKELGLPDAKQLSIADITQRVFYTSNHYTGGETRETPADHKFPELPEVPKAYMLEES